MGGCCFTPKKTQLLWWYWLLLFSLVGIPMFGAALYVRRAARHGLLEPWQVRRASLIFWLGACLSLLLVCLVLFSAGFEIRRLPGTRYWNAAAFAGGFLFWLMVAVAAAKLTEKTRPGFGRAGIVACCAILPAIAAWWSWALVEHYWMDAVSTLPTSVMKFLVCMLPAHYWYRFTVAPSTKRAWLFLGTLAAGTVLFWAVSQYGYDMHLGVHRWWLATVSHGH
jgi:hypothetical protein